MIKDEMEDNSIFRYFEQRKMGVDMRGGLREINHL